MTLGADRNKILILGALVLVGGYMFYSNVLSTPNSGPQAAAREPVPATPAALRTGAALPSVVAGAQPSIRRAGSRARSVDEWHPSLKRRPEDPDPMSVDPTLRLDLLARVQNVNLEGGSRNLFQFGPPPVVALPKGPEPKIVPKTPAEIAQEAKAAAPAPPVKPPPPPITLKYYGFSTAKTGGPKTAFFLDGDEILIGAEGQTVKRRYKVVRIGVNSVVVEDTESKNQQTLPLAEEAATG